MGKRGRISKEYKEQAVLKYLNRGTKQVGILADELNTSSNNIYRWVKELDGGSSTMKNKKSKTKLTADKKFSILLETANFDEPELGEYLRKHGLKSSDLSEWKANFINSGSKVGRPRLDPEIVKLRESKQKLTKNLYRKDKALAEMSARIILLKKSHEIFGVDNEDDD